LNGPVETLEVRFKKNEGVLHDFILSSGLEGRFEERITSEQNGMFYKNEFKTPRIPLANKGFNRTT